ncbi:hypothetical protein ABK905_09900 [Acerihabitans sp. KWT182]|uniref:Uncharacterized protein n=1 Tax=Acerihabitans sp. KWT182 TaxID=3157919 RepID=A0AAU7QDR7_9GAMM
MADTLKHGEVYQAFPTLRGAKASDFSSLQEAASAGEVRSMNSLEQLAAHLANAATGDINAVLTMDRPKTFWRRLFSPVDGHACNIMKCGHDIFLADGQKKSFAIHRLPSDDELSTERSDALMVRQTADLASVLARHLGALDPTGDGLKLYNIGWSQNPRLDKAP